MPQEFFSRGRRSRCETAGVCDAGSFCKGDWQGMKQSRLQKWRRLSSVISYGKGNPVTLEAARLLAMSCADRKDADTVWGPARRAARLRRTSDFAAGENLGGGAIHLSRAFQSPEGGDGLWPPEPTKKDIHWMSFFVEHRNSIDATAFAHSQATGILFFTPQEIALRYETPELRFGDPASESPSG